MAWLCADRRVMDVGMDVDKILNKVCLDEEYRRCICLFGCLYIFNLFRVSYITNLTVDVEMRLHQRSIPAINVFCNSSTSILTPSPARRSNRLSARLALLASLFNVFRHNG